MTGYYAIQVKPGYEFKTQKSFKLLIGPESEAELIVFSQTKYIKFKNNIRSVKAAVVPGYVFCRCENLTEELYYFIKKIPGVVRVLRENIPAEQVMEMMKRCLKSCQRILQRVRELKKLKEESLLIFKRPCPAGQYIRKGWEKARQAYYRYYWGPLLN